MIKNNVDKEIFDPDNYKLSIFYYNPEDKRVVVPKQDRYRGWTLNFGNFYTYLLILACIILGVVLSVF